MENAEFEFKEKALDSMKRLKRMILNNVHLFCGKEIQVPWFYTNGCNMFVFNVKQLKFTKLLCPNGRILMEFSDNEGCITNMTKMH